jgi:cytochrome c-type biogenesis protein CcmH/NrfG
LGAAELAWEYLTTPLAARPNEAAPWRQLGELLRQQGQFELADRALAAAFEAEPTNAQILWDRAEVLFEAGRPEAARGLLVQIAENDWQPAFEHLRSQAGERLEAF